MNHFRLVIVSPECRADPRERWREDVQWFTHQGENLSFRAHSSHSCYLLTAASNTWKNLQQFPLLASQADTEMMSSSSSNNKPSFWSQPFAAQKHLATIPREHIIVVSINQSLNPWISIFMCHFVTTRNTQTIYQHCFRKSLLAFLDTFVTNQNLPVYIKRASSCQHSLICYWFLASPRLPPKVL